MEHLIQIAKPQAAQYAPYHTMPAFWRGFSDYVSGLNCEEPSGVDGQAYDRGQELAMKVRRG